MASEGDRESVGPALRLAEHKTDAPSRSRAEAAMMARNGISCIPVNYYHVDGFRYTSLAEAVSQVTRGGPRRESIR